MIIDNKIHRQKTVSAGALKKLVMEVFERHLRVQFARWRDNTKHRDDEA